MSRYILWSLLSLVLLNQHSFSQGIPDSVVIEAGSLVAHGENVPFWLVSNRYGTIDNTAFNGWVRASAFRQYHSEKAVAYTYGLDVYNLYSNENRVILNQAFLGLRLSFLEIEAGKRREQFGNQDSVLSSGGLLWSGNASPLPKVTIRTAGYVPVPFTSEYLYFRGGISHGWFGNTEFTDRVWLHHKYFFIRTTEKFPVVISAGMHHFAQWGGTSKDSAIGHLPSDLQAFWSVFTAKSGSSESPDNERLNALGNHLGSYNIRLDIHLKNSTAGLYWQSIFEDNSGRKLRNGGDGLWGISFRMDQSSLWPSGFVFEYLKTTDQSGVVIIDPNHTAPPTGNDNYFNNGIYKNGWSYQDRTLGNALISSPFYFRDEAGNYFLNNRVKACHFGLSGQLERLDFKYEILYTYSHNFGTYSYPFASDYKSQSVVMGFHFDNIFHTRNCLSFSAAMDYGEMYGRNAGLQVRFSRRLF